jgi:hypothetical protein
MLLVAATPLTLRYPRAVQKAGKFIIGWFKGLLEWWDPRATYPEMQHDLTILAYYGSRQSGLELA